jgi:hypothetical protein
MKKHFVTSILFLFTCAPAILACDLCKKNQPKGLENITHGAGPTGPMDYVISWLGVAIVLITLFLFIKYLVKPNDAKHSQIKNIVVNND